MRIEDILRTIVREEVEAAVAPIREQLMRMAWSAPATSDEDELSLLDAEKACGYSPITLRKAIRAKELAGLKGGKEWRTRRGDLKAWMARKRPQTHALSHVAIAAKADAMLAKISARREGTKKARAARRQPAQNDRKL